MSTHTFKKVDAQPTLPGEFTPPPPECEVRKGDHFWHAIHSYSKIRYYPPEAYEEYCLFCGIPKKP